jgi:pimeloyl-ACP methyl ester carboxylesterase
MMQELARYWAADYDWRKCEEKLNALPQFMTEIDGLDIHFIHVRSAHENGLPLIVTHGWPGSVIEQLKIIDPLTNPTAHGASASDAFDLVIPSMPGYGFSGKPTATGWDPARIKNKLSLYNDADVSVPAAVSVFPGENYQAPRSWTERAYHNLTYFNEVDKGGHFAAWEQPQLFSEEVRAGFRPLRK